MQVKSMPALPSPTATALATLRVMPVWPKVRRLDFID